eukprot:scaffold5655_cov200-Pinguiococcus_pyrenoidosus.AAC.1
MHTVPVGSSVSRCLSAGMRPSVQLFPMCAKRSHPPDPSPVLLSSDLLRDVSFVRPSALRKTSPAVPPGRPSRRIAPRSPE